MARHFFAITLFIGAFFGFSAMLPLGTASASDFTEHFIFAKPPASLPPFTFQDAKGQVLDLKNYAGSYVLLNLWATWCGPCTKEMPALDALAEHFDVKRDTQSPPKAVTISMMQFAAKPRLQIIAVAEDREGLAAAEAFYKTHNLKHLPVFVDTTGEMPSLLKIRGLPTTFLVDPKGFEIGHIEGQTDWDDPATIAFLDAQLKPLPPKTP